MIRELRISIDCPPEFRRAARYALAMLALIAGRRPRFVRADADLHYGPSPSGGAVWLAQSPEAVMLLEHRRPRLRAVDIELHGVRILGLFPVSEGVVPTDIVAAAFFFLSLHEEWTSDVRDQFGRRIAADSLLGARDELDRPVVSEYALLLAALIGEDPASSRPRFDRFHAAAVMTHDIDYLSKWTPGLIFREAVKNLLFNRRHVSAADRLVRFREYLSYARRENDPYIVSIKRMLAVQQRLGIDASWLFKSGGRDKRDVTYRLSSSRARAVITLLSEAGQDIGLHPSFHAHSDADMLAREAARLRAAIPGGEPKSIRQHYLRFEYPSTWRNQAAEGFVVDSTLGFAEREGFRNGVCHPFLPWDAETAAPIPIWELPLTVMDGTLAHYRGLDTEASKQRIASLLEITAAHRGVAVLLFHNTSYDAHDFPGWDGVHEDAAGRIADGRFFTASMPQVIDAWLASAGFTSTEDVVQVINSEPVE